MTPLLKDDLYFVIHVFLFAQADPTSLDLPKRLKELFTENATLDISREMAKIKDPSMLNAFMEDIVVTYGERLGYTLDDVTHQTDDLILQCKYMMTPCNRR